MLTEQKAEPTILQEDIWKLVDLGLSYTLADSLYEAGLRVIGDAVKRGKTALVHTPDIGPVRIAQIEEVLKRQGITLPE